MNADSGSPINRCVNCSASYDDDGNYGATKVQEIFLGNESLTSGQEINSEYLEVGRILRRIFKLNYIPDDCRDEEEEELLKINPDDLSVCERCSHGLTQLWKVYNAFLDLGEQNSYLSMRIAKLDEIIEKQWKPPVGSFIQLRRDIFDDDDSKSTETEEVVSITPVSEPRIRGKIPVKVQDVMPEPSVLSLRSDENLLPSPISDLIVGDEDVNFEDDQLWGRLAVTPEIQCDQQEVVSDEKLDTNPASMSSDVTDKEINGLNSSGTCRAVSYSIFSSYRPAIDLPSQLVSSSTNKSTTSSNRRKSSVITRQCTDAIEFVPRSQQDKSLSLLSPPAPLQPRILSRKRKLPIANTPLEAAILTSFEIIGELQALPVPTTDQEMPPPPPKIPKVAAAKKVPKGKSKKAKGKKKGSKSRKKSRRVKTRADSARSYSAQAQSNSTNLENISENTPDFQETAEKGDCRNSEPAPVAPILKSTQITFPDAIKKPEPTIQTHSERKANKKAAAEIKSSKDGSPEFQIFKAVSQPNGNKDDRTIPTIKIFKAVPSTRPSDTEKSHSVTNASQNGSSNPSSKLNHPESDTQISSIDFREDLEKSGFPISDSKKFSSKKGKKKKWSNSLSDGNLHTHHRLRKQKAPYPCWYCSMDFVDISDVLEHTKTKHSFDPVKSILCQQCAKISNSPQAYKYHVKTCFPPKKPAKISPAPHSGNKYRCPICLKLFLKKSFPIHLKVTHSDERPFPCDACEYKAKTPYRLKIHRFKVHNLQTSKTSYGGKKFSGSATSALDIAANASDNSINSVGKGSNDVITVAEDGVMIVGTVKQEQSTSNGTSEKTTSLKNRPMQEDRPFPCDVCNYRGLTQVGLHAHKKKNHQLVKCTECESMFVDKYILQEHIRTTHDTQGVTYRKKLRTRCPVWSPLETSEKISTKMDTFETETSNENPVSSGVQADNVLGVNLVKPIAQKNTTVPGRILEESGRDILKSLEPGDAEPMDLSNPNHQTRESGQQREPKSDVFKEPGNSEVCKAPGNSEVCKAPGNSEIYTESVNSEDAHIALKSNAKKHLKSLSHRKHSKSQDHKKRSKIKEHKKHSKSEDRKKHVIEDQSQSHPEVENKQKLVGPEQNQNQDEVMSELIEDLSDLPQKKQFHCQDCNTSYPSKYRLIKHKMAEHGFTKTAKFFCDRCSKGFFTEESRRVHQDTLHGLEKAFTCQFCGKEFVKTSTMKNHMKHIHPNEANPYCCNKCGVSFDDVSGLRDHAYICSESKTDQPVNDNNIINTVEEGDAGEALT